MIQPATMASPSPLNADFDEPMHFKCDRFLLAVTLMVALPLKERASAIPLPACDGSPAMTRFSSTLQSEALAYKVGFMRNSWQNATFGIRQMAAGALWAPHAAAAIMPSVGILDISSTYVIPHHYWLSVFVLAAYGGAMLALTVWFFFTAFAVMGGFGKLEYHDQLAHDQLPSDTRGSELFSSLLDAPEPSTPRAVDERERLLTTAGPSDIQRLLLHEILGKRGARREKAMNLLALYVHRLVPHQDRLPLSLELRRLTIYRELERRIWDMKLARKSLRYRSFLARLEQRALFSRTSDLLYDFLTYEQRSIMVERQYREAIFLAIKAFIIGTIGTFILLSFSDRTPNWGRDPRMYPSVNPSRVSA